MFNRLFATATFLVLLPLSLTTAAQEQTFGDWQYRCGEDACALSQVALNADQAPVMQFSLFQGKEDRTLVRLALPLNVNLRRGVMVTQGEVKQLLEYLYCSENSCFAGGVLPPEMLAAFRAGNQAGVNFFSIKAGPLRAGVSLKGFTAGHKKLLAQ